MKLFKLYKYIFFLLIGCSFGCKKMIEVDLPIDMNTAETVFKDKSTAMAALVGIYEKISAEEEPFTGNLGQSIRVGLMADELTPNVAAAYPDYGNNSSQDNAWTFWTPVYREYIFGLNSIIEGVSKSESLASSVKTQITAEAKFLRAWMYFGLVNFYGDAPLVLGTDYKVNSKLPRATVQSVYEQIVKDLLEARQDISADYTKPSLTAISDERIRANKAVVNAFLARVYLYMEKWQDAENAATLVIDDPRFELLTDLNTVFLKNSKETIWQLQPNPDHPHGGNTPDGQFLINPFGGDPFFQLSNYIQNAFEPGDLRKDNWVTTSMPTGRMIPFKYKLGTGVMEQSEYTTVIRLAELYLIRSEARAHLGKITGAGSAEEDLNAVRTRAGLEETTASTPEEMLEAILHERQVELFLEWGHRWLDLKRMSKLDEVMSAVTPVKGGVWSSYKSLLPIPYSEFLYYPELRGHQNPGYREQP